MTLQIVLILVVFINLLLSIFVLTQKPESLNNRFFSLLSFIAAIWTFTNYMTGVYSTPIWLESTYAFGDLVLAIGLLWTLVITDKVFNRKLALLIVLFSAFFFINSYQDGFIARNYEQIYIGGVFTGTPGIGLFVYTLFYLAAAVGILYKLFIAQKYADGERKIQLNYVFYGALFTLTITAFTSFILPVFSIFSLSGLDSIGFLVFLSFIALSITKGHLFNIKVITTEIITFALWIIILIRTIIADNIQEMLVEGGMLIITIIFGIFLIKSVIHEVNQRERIEKLATDLKKANTRLLGLDKQKSEFVSFASHQLRAPLTAMKGYASLLIEGEFGPISKEVSSAISRILDSSKTLTNIVNDYLNVSRIELGAMKYSFETINLKDLTESVIAELKPNIEKSGLKFSFTLEPSNPDERFMIKADKDKFKQVIGNLIDNSLKYTKSGNVDVSIHKNISTRKILFSVKDNGIGISPEVMPSLFTKFVRSGTANKQNIYGTGLGLFVARDIVTAHNGKIWAESDGDGKGSIFNVEVDMVV